MTNGGSVSRCVTTEKTDCSLWLSLLQCYARPHGGFTLTRKSFELEAYVGLELEILEA